MIGLRLERLVGVGLLILAVASLGVGCSEGTDEPQGQAVPTASNGVSSLGAGGGTANSASVAPDMCAEHGVLESVCTICNPALAAIFQSKGDWCAEHSLPESFCPFCSPESGGRPANEISMDEAPSHGLKVLLDSPEIAERSGLEVVRAESPKEGLLVVSTATLVPENSRMASLGPKVDGVLRSFRVREGETVKRGDILASLASADVADARGDLRAARIQRKVAADHLERERSLHDRGISPLRSLQLAEQELAATEAAVEMAASVLRMVGADEEGPEGIFEMRSPIDGVVVEREGSVGEMLHADHAIFEVLDASVLWADIDVPELHAARVRPGQKVELEVDGLGDRVFTGRIDYISPVVDPRTRTVRARAIFDNEDAALRANTYARVRILVPAEESGVLVPRSAVQETRGVQLVFVPVGPAEYETRRVRTAPSDSDLLPVISGVEAGEEVVTTGSFLLMTETLKGAIGAGCCEPAPGEM